MSINWKEISIVNRIDIFTRLLVGAIGVILGIYMLFDAAYFVQYGWSVLVLSVGILGLMMAYKRTKDFK